jgi:hypothetical protein
LAGQRNPEKILSGPGSTDALWALKERLWEVRQLILQRPFWRLTAHFAGRIFETGGEAGEGELDLGIGAMLALLAAPGAFAAILLFQKYSTLSHFFRGITNFDAYAASLPDSYFFIVFSAVITGAVTILKWDSIFPDRRDYLNLAPLPLSIRNIFIANLIAVITIAVLFAVDVNAVSSVVFPFIVNIEGRTFHEFVRFTGIHIVSVLLASMFIFFATFAAVGLLMVVLPRTIFRRCSIYFRIAAIIYFFMLLVSTTLVPAILRQPGPLPLWVKLLPPVWFLGFARALIGQASPELAALGSLGLRIIVATAVAAILLYAVSYYRHFIRIPETLEAPIRKRATAQWSSSGLIQRFILRTPFQKAGYPFILKTLFRSERHSLFFGAFAGLGLVIASQRLLSAVNRGGTGLNALNSDLFSVPLVLAFFVIFGLRFVFEIPSDLRANWIQKMLVDCDKHESAPLARKVILSFVLPWIVLPSIPLYAWFFGWRVALQQALVLTVCSCLLIELLLVRFRKIPFTCTYPKWKDHAIVAIVLYALGFQFFTAGISSFEAWLLLSARHLPVFFVLSAAVCMGISRLKPQYEHERRLIFEEQRSSGFELLELSRRD